MVKIKIMQKQPKSRVIKVTKFISDIHFADYVEVQFLRLVVDADIKF